MKLIIRGIAKLFGLGRQLGLRRSVLLVYRVVLEPSLMRLVPPYAKFLRALVLVKRSRRVDSTITQWAARKDEVLDVGRVRYQKRVQEVWSGSEQIQPVVETRHHTSDQVLAEIDQDGLLLSHVGPLPIATSVSAEMFLPRQRFDLTVVDHAGILAVRKDFRKDRFSFITELIAAHHLALAGCNVPAILDVDFDDLTIVYSYIMGDVLRESLVKHGAILRDRDIDSLPQYQELSTKGKHRELVREGRRVLNQVLDVDARERLFTQLRKIHATGYILHDIKYGNVIMERESGEPYFIDFNRASTYPRIGKLANRFLRDSDYHKFNQYFGTEKLTYDRVKQLMKGESPSYLQTTFYAPVCIEGGVRFGSLRNIGVSYGRWHYILKNHLPSLGGRRILDLGSNNGYVAMQMLRSGAREVYAIEQREEAIAQGHFLKELLEWADNAEYNLRFISEDMANVPHLDLGEFDYATALCSLYYLDDKSIARVVRYLSTITDTFVIQCNVDRYTERSDPRVFKKSTVEYGVGALKENGFPVTEVIAPRGYSRPLIIGRKG